MSYGYAPGRRELPQSLAGLRILLRLGGAIGVLTTLGFLTAVGLSAENVGTAIWAVGPAVAALLLARRVADGGRGHLWVVVVVGGVWVLMGLAELGRGEARGLTSLAVPIAVLVLVTRPSAQEYLLGGRFREGRGRWWSGSESGQASTEYVGSLLASAVVVALVFTVAAVPQTRQQVVAAARTAVCTIGGGTNCGGATPANGSAAPRTEGAGDGSATEDPGDWDCHGFWGCTWNGVKQVGSGGYNIGKGAVDDVVGVYDLVKDPGQLADAGKYMWAHPGDAAKELVWDQDSGEMWDGEDYGGAAGRTIWNVGSWFIPGVDIAKGVSKAGKLGKIGKAAEVAADLAKAGRLADEAGALARTAEKAAARGDVQGAREAAVAARKKADEAAEDARSRGCPVAVGRLGRPRSEFGPQVVLASGGGRGSLGASVVLSSPFHTADDCGTASAAAERADAEADTAEQAAVSPLVVGGGLAAHEARGGHAIARHVGKTDQELLDRVAAEPGISGASTFLNRADAEKFVSETMTANSETVEKLATGRLLNRRGRVRQSVEIEKEFQVPVGRSVRSGSNVITETKKVRVVLEVDSSELGYHILTAFPVP